MLRRLLRLLTWTKLRQSCASLWQVLFLLSFVVIFAFLLVRRTVKDPETGLATVLTDEEVELLQRLQAGAYPHADFDPYEVGVKENTTLRDTAIHCPCLHCVSCADAGYKVLCSLNKTKLDAVCAVRVQF